MRKLWLLTAGLVVLAACSSSTPAAPRDPGAPELAGSAWTVTTINGTASLTDARPTMAFADGRATGLASCNRYSAGYTQDGAGLAFDQVASTAMACSPEAVMTQEQAFTEALGKVAGLRPAGDGLELVDASGRPLLTLAPVAPVADRPLEGTVWQLSGIRDGEAVASPVAGTTVTMQLSGGRLTGKACNNFHGPVRVDGESFAAGPLASTKMACADAENAQETTVLAALEAAKTFAIEGDRLTLATAEGSGLEFVAAG